MPYTLTKNDIISNTSSVTGNNNKPIHIIYNNALFSPIYYTESPWILLELYHRLLVTVATHGSLSAFGPSKEDWTSYTDRMKHYFIVNGVDDEGKKWLILLSACGASVFKLIQNLIEKDKLNTTSYNDIVKKVKAHYDPQPSVTMQRYKFNIHSRAEGESVATMSLR